MTVTATECQPEEPLGNGDVRLAACRSPPSIRTWTALMPRCWARFPTRTSEPGERLPAFTYAGYVFLTTRRPGSPTSLMVMSLASYRTAVDHSPPTRVHAWRAADQTLHQIRMRLPRELAHGFRPHTGALARSVIEAVARGVPEYAQPMAGPLGQFVAAAAQAVITRGIDAVLDPRAPREVWSELFRGIGRARSHPSADATPSRGHADATRGRAAPCRARPGGAEHPPLDTALPAVATGRSAAARRRRPDS